MEIQCLRQDLCLSAPEHLQDCPDSHAGAAYRFCLGRFGGDCSGLDWFDYRLSNAWRLDQGLALFPIIGYFIAERQLAAANLVHTDRHIYADRPDHDRNHDQQRTVG